MGVSVRTVCVIALSGSVVMSSLGLALVRSPAWPVSAPTTQSITTAFLPPVPAAGLQSGSPEPANAGLSCLQQALGGVAAFAGVSSLRITAETKVTVTSGPRPMASKREIGVVFPDRYRITNAPLGSAGATIVSGFNGNVPLSNMRPPGQSAATVEPVTRRRFVQQILMRLPRELPGIRLSPRTMQDAGQERLAFDASGSGYPGLDATLLADPRTCMPVAIEYSESDPFANRRVTERVALSQYRRFGGILFPTLLRTTRDGKPWSDELVSEVLVNVPFDDGYFRAGGK